MSFHSSSILCPYCNSSDIITDTSVGDEICRSCAAVIGERLISSDAEWREYDNDDRGSSVSLARASRPTADGDDSQTTYILPGSNAALSKNLTKYHMKVSFSNSDLRVVEFMRNLNDIASKLNLSERISVSYLFLFLPRQ